MFHKINMFKVNYSTIRSQLENFGNQTSRENQDI